MKICEPMPDDTCKCSARKVAVFIAIGNGWLQDFLILATTDLSHIANWLQNSLKSVASIVFS